MRLFKSPPKMKPLVYFISETIIVTIGILIAIQLNNWNDSRKQKAEGTEALERIYTDLETERYILNLYADQFKKKEKSLRDIMYHDRKEHIDSIIHYFTAFNHYKMNAEYVNLKYSGKLGLIENDNLRYLLVSYYEVVYAQFDQLTKSHQQFHDDRLLPYFNSQFDSDTTSILKAEIVEEKLKDRNLQNLIIDQIGIYGQTTDFIEVDRIDTLVVLIRQELGNAQ